LLRPGDNLHRPTPPGQQTVPLPVNSVKFFTVRPSADLLLESVAASFKQQVIAVVLTGAMVPWGYIKQMGGITITLAGIIPVFGI